MMLVLLHKSVIVVTNHCTLVLETTEIASVHCNRPHHILGLSRNWKLKFNKHVKYESPTLLWKTWFTRRFSTNRCSMGYVQLNVPSATYVKLLSFKLLSFVILLMSSRALFYIGHNAIVFTLKHLSNTHVV